MSKEAVRRSFEHTKPLFEVVPDHKGLKSALTQGTKVAVLNNGDQNIPFSRVELYGDSGFVVAANRARDVLVKHRPETAAKKISKLRNELCRHVQTLSVSAESKAAMVAIFDIAVADFVALRDAFPDYQLDRFGFLLLPNELIERWHQDDQNGSGTLLRYVRTIQGPSTELSYNGKGEGRTTLPNGSSVVLTTGNAGAWHRSPTEWPPNRVGFALWLKPKK